MKKLEANLIAKNLDGFVVQCIIVSLSIFDYCKVDLGTNLIISWKLPFLSLWWWRLRSQRMYTSWSCFQWCLQYYGNDSRIGLCNIFIACIKKYEVIWNSNYSFFRKWKMLQFVDVIQNYAMSLKDFTQLFIWYGYFWDQYHCSFEDVWNEDWLKQAIHNFSHQLVAAFLYTSCTYIVQSCLFQIYHVKQ